MGVKGILGGGMLSDSKTVGKVTQPVKQYGIGGVSTANQVTNFDKEILAKKKKAAGAAGAIGSTLIN